jgi:hypothetical protein
MPDTEVISCPACRHVVRVPTDWLGQTVQCPECKATFTAPVRENGRLTDPVLITAPAPAAAPRPARNGLTITVAGVGLVLVGLVSFVANAVVFAEFVRGPDGGKAWLMERLPNFRQMGLAPPAGEAAAAADDDKAAAELAPKLFWVWPAAMALAGLTAAGGVSMIRRRNYRLAQLGCAAAAVNLPHLCCVPGAVCAFWGMLALLGDDGFGPPRERTA